MSEFLKIVDPKRFRNTDVVNIKTSDGQLMYCWKVKEFDDKFVYLGNNGEAIKVEVAIITKVEVIHQPAVCKQCNQPKVGVYEDGLCGTCKALNAQKLNRENKKIYRLDYDKVTLEYGEDK